MLTIDGNDYVGKGSSTDIIEASALAYLNAINRHHFRNGMQNPANNPIKGEQK